MAVRLLKEGFIISVPSKRVVSAVVAIDVAGIRLIVNPACVADLAANVGKKRVGRLRVPIPSSIPVSASTTAVGDPNGLAPANTVSLIGALHARVKVSHGMFLP